MRKLPFILFVLLLLGLTSSVHGQVSFELTASANLVRSHEALIVTYTLHQASGEDFEVPEFKDWEVLAGPASRTTTQLENGVRSVFQEISYRLQPKHTGSCLVPKATILVKGKTYQSNSLQIEVVKRSDETQAAQPATQADAAGFTYDAFMLDSRENANEKIARNLFIKTVVSKQECYAGESVVVEYLLYSRVNLNAQVDKRPGFTGFSSIDLETEVPMGQYYYGYHGGKVFRIYPLRKVHLSPLRAGHLALEPLEVAATVSFMKVPPTEKPRDFDPYSPDKMSEVTQTIRAEKTAIEVLPLPEAGRPADSTPPVGRFSIATAFAKQDLSAGQTGELKITISGIGQWSMIQTPQISWPAGIMAFEPLVEESLDSQAVPVKGSRTYRYRFSADSTMQLTLPAVAFTFFDPWKKEYQQAKASVAPMLIHASLASNTSPSYDLNDPGSFHLTDWFTHFAPILFLGLGLFLVLFLLRQRAVRNSRRMLGQMPDNIDHEWNELDTPFTGSAKHAGTASTTVKRTAPFTEVTTMQDESSETILKLTARQILQTCQQQDWPSHLLAEAAALKMLCEQLLYAPAAAEISAETLRESWESLQRKITA